MKTVVQFIKNPRARKGRKGGNNSVFTRSLRKVAFIDNRYSRRDLPQHNEHWLVDIIRENQNDNGGCFILKPLQVIPSSDLMPLLHGMYDLRLDDDAIIIKPHDNTKFWVMSPQAKKSILDETKGARALVIFHGGRMWQRRDPPESLLEREAQSLLEELEED